MRNNVTEVLACREQRKRKIGGYAESFSFQCTCNIESCNADFTSIDGWDLRAFPEYL